MGTVLGTVYMTVDRFWDLLSKKISAEASPEELNEFDQLVSDKPEWKKTAETFAALWQQSAPPDNTEALGAFQLHLEKIKKLGNDFNVHDDGHAETELSELKRIHSKGRRWLVFTAVIAGVAIVFSVVRSITTSHPQTLASTEPISQVITKSGSKTQIHLPDGSSVWLNASSDLTYDKSFGKTLREVYLMGEAFFDVVKDPAHPFIIHTKIIDVKVLGTQFNVRAYPNDSYTEASLIRGSLEVTVKTRPDEKHYLRPNEKISVANNIDGRTEKGSTSEPMVLTEPLTYYHADSTVIETSWVDNKLVFQENETFRDVARKMERWFGGIKIDFADEEVANYRIYGSFTNETITQALDALHEAFKFSYKFNGNNITITK